MTNIQIGLILLSIPVILVLGGAIYDKENNNSFAALGASALIVLPLIWGIYFLLK